MQRVRVFLKLCLLYKDLGAVVSIALVGECQFTFGHVMAYSLYTLATFTTGHTV